MRNILYYNIDDNLDYENRILSEKGITDLKLIEVKDPDRRTPLYEIINKNDIEGIVVEYDKITDELMEKCPSLKIVSLQSIGYNNVDIESATRHSVLVCNIPGFCADEVSLHTIGFMLDLTRSITFLDRTVQAGKWDPLLSYPMHRLRDKVFGMVFFGEIPKRIVPILHAFGMKIMVYAPTKTKEYLSEYGCKKAESLDQLLSSSDYVSLHCPLIPGVTEHMISDREFDLMKPDAFFINTSRGAVVDEPALVRALKEKKILAAAIDVIEDEINEKSDLFGLENCIMTPHSAFLSEDSFYEARERCLSHLIECLSEKGTGKYNSLVNKELLE